MAFWKQSDDPWDRKPDKRPTEPREPRENPIDGMKAWNERRKSAAKEKEEARRLPPEKCPWCGKDMEQGYLLGGRGAAKWYPGFLTAKAAWIGRSDVRGLDVLDEWNFLAYKTTWFCRDCKKMVFDAPEPEEYAPFSSTLTESYQSDETKEEEKSER